MRFKAVLERAGNGLGWTTVRVPFNPQETWTKCDGCACALKVLGRKAPAIEFRTSLFPAPGESGRYLLSSIIGFSGKRVLPLERCAVFPRGRPGASAG